MLSNIFDSDQDLNILKQRLLKKHDGCIKMNFKQVRKNYCKKSEDKKLCDKMRELKGENDDESREALEPVVKAIAESSEAK